MESGDIEIYMEKATVISKTLIPYPSRWSHPDEHTYLRNQFSWAVTFAFNILKDVKLNGETAKEKWNTEMKNCLKNVVKHQLIKACLDENFKTVPQKCSLTPEEEDEYSNLAYQDECRYGY
jgi:hypothetical protein